MASAASRSIMERKMEMDFIVVDAKGNRMKDVISFSLHD